MRVWPEGIARPAEGNVRTLVRSLVIECAGSLILGRSKSETQESKSNASGACVLWP